MTFQELIFALQGYWSQRGCVVLQPYDMEMGAGTFHPATFLKVLGPEPWNTAYVQPSRRPTDGRYGENPNRLQHYYQFQVILKPSPEDLQQQYLQSLQHIGIDLAAHDVRFVEDDWESPTLGAWGLGWEVWLDGMEVTQFTYFQQVGGLDLKPVAGELTYGLERLAMYIQGVENVYDLVWTEGVSYGDVFHHNEVDFSHYNFEQASTELLLQKFNLHEKEALHLAEKNLSLPAYDQVIACSHAFNLLDARGAISVTERAGYIGRVRNLARRTAECYVQQREEMGFPLLNKHPVPASLPMEEPPEAVALATLAAFPKGRKSVFLWEIGCEEIPAGLLPAAIDALGSMLEKALTDVGLWRDGQTACHCQGTPRRLLVEVSGLAEQQTDVEEVRRGPMVSRGFKEDGSATPAALGFAKSCGVAVEDLTRQQTKKGEYLACVIHTPGKAAQILLVPIMGTILATFPWKKSMRWGSGEMTFVRPINWIVALFNGQPLAFRTEDGLQAGVETYGHRFMCPGPLLVVEQERVVVDLASYRQGLRQAKVMLDLQERKNLILDGVERLAALVGGRAVISASLLSENACLTEWPMPLLGRFSEKYLQIPSEVLMTSMQYHQKYFPVQSVEAGESKLLPCFVAVANLETPDQKVLVKGYERVLRARLEDAAFFWDEDRKVKLAERLPGLHQVVFQAKLGTLHQKAVRMSRLAVYMGSGFAVVPDAAVVEQAALLSKCDLISGMVGEFPELQGVMGGYYWLEEGGDAEVALAIRQHYRPQGMADALPETTLATLVSMADKLDTLVGCFAVGLVPSGTKDPFALRRAALGLIRMMLDGQVHLSLRDVVDFAYRLYEEGMLQAGKSRLEQDVDQTVEAVLRFFYGRLKAYLKADGLDYDLIDAVEVLGLDDLSDAVLRIRALATFKSLDSYAALVAANKRIANIITKAGDWQEGKVDAALLQLPAEVVLYEAVCGCESRVEALVQEHAYGAALGLLAELRGAIDQFFDDVMVMDKDLQIRHNRLALLAQVRQSFRLVADVSCLVLVEA